MVNCRAWEEGGILVLVSGRVWPGTSNCSLVVIKS